MICKSAQEQTTALVTNNKKEHNNQPSFLSEEVKARSSTLMDVEQY
jgi:hypothetical protein